MSLWYTLLILAGTTVATCVGGMGMSMYENDFFNQDAGGSMYPLYGGNWEDNPVLSQNHRQSMFIPYNGDRRQRPEYPLQSEDRLEYKYPHIGRGRTQNFEYPRWSFSRRESIYTPYDGKRRQRPEYLSSSQDRRESMYTPYDDERRQRPEYPALSQGRRSSLYPSYIADGIQMSEYPSMNLDRRTSMLSLMGGIGRRMFPWEHPTLSLDRRATKRSRMGGNGRRMFPWKRPDSTTKYSKTY